MTARPSALFLIPPLLALAASAPAQAPEPMSAMNPNTILVFGSTNFGGRTFTINGEQPNLRVPFQVRSVRIGRGPAWQLCLRTRFRNCTRFDRDTPNTRMVVQSARPVQPPAPPGGGAALRGMASEFFPRPSDARGRVVSCASGAAACAADSANRFCRARGWNRAAFHMQETVGRQNYLADVLCSNM